MLIALVVLIGILLFSKISKAPLVDPDAKIGSPVSGTTTRAVKDLPSSTPITPSAKLPHIDFREISKVDTSKKQAVITINAGFGEKSAEGILTALKKHNEKATFFLVGEWVEDHPELTKRIAREGHEIFNHSYSHPDYPSLTAEEIKNDLQKMDDVLYNLTGLRTRPYYRAPSGARNLAVNQAAAEAGFQHIYWSLDPQDWRTDISGETIKNQVLSNIHPGAIILFHIANSATGEVIDEIFTKLKDEGYELVSLTEAI